MQKNKYIAAFTIENNHLPTMKVSNLVIGYSRVEEAYNEYRKLPESQRSLMVNDFFTFNSIEEALNDHLDAVSREASLNRHLSPIEEVSIDTSPKVIGRIELPEGSISSDDYCCERCGRDTDSSWGDSRHILRVRDEVYGTWREELICDYCCHSDFENSLNIN